MAWRGYTTIYLLEGVHTLSTVSLDSSYKKCTDDLSPLSRQSTTTQGQQGGGQKTTTTTSKSTVTVKTALCSDLNISGCASSAATIELTSDKVVLSASSIKLVFSGVKLDGTKSLYTDKCTSGDSCSYCPYYIEVAKGYLMDDRGNVSEVRDLQVGRDCESFNDIVFITVANGGALTMKDVQVNNFRQQFSSIISADGAVTLQNTDFDNVQTGRDAVVVGNCKTDPSTSCVFTYTSGSITRLNNGYEYRSDLVQYGFLSLTRFYSVALSSLTFSKNAVFYGSSSTPTLISLSSTYMTSTLSSLTFDTNLSGGSLMTFDYTDLSYSGAADIELDSQGYSILHTQTHLTISGLTLKQNSCSYAVKHTEASQSINAKISFTAETNYFLSSAISFQKTESTSEADIYGGSFSFSRYNTKYVAYTKPYVVELTATATKSIGGAGLIYASSIPKLVLTGSSFKNVLSTDKLTINTVSLDAFIADSQIYLKNEVYRDPVYCNNVVSLSSAYSFEASSSTC
jgi:hypothetical protein